MKVVTAIIIAALIVILCAMQGHLPVVEYLCNKSANVNQATNNGWTPLSVAASSVSMQSKDCMHINLKYYCQYNYNSKFCKNMFYNNLYTCIIVVGKWAIEYSLHSSFLAYQGYYCMILLTTYISSRLYLSFNNIRSNNNNHNNNNSNNDDSNL